MDIFHYISSLKHIIELFNSFHFFHCLFLVLLIFIPFILFFKKHFQKSSWSLHSFSATKRSNYQEKNKKFIFPFLSSIFSTLKSSSPTDNYSNIKNSVDKDDRSVPKIEKEKIIQDALSGRISLHKIESLLNNDHFQAIQIRREIIQKKLNVNSESFNDIPCENFDYSIVANKCCENVIGYVQIPLGIVGPLTLDGQDYHIPMATTEGALVASTQRGCKALYLSGGVKTILYNDGMTRSPIVSMPNIDRVLDLINWIHNPANFEKLKKSFNSTSRFGRLQTVETTPAGCDLYLRFKATTGDAMGMNMVSKGCEKSLLLLQEHFPDMTIVSISGNYCTDKKPAAVNWIRGRGKSVIASALLPGSILSSVLKTSASLLVEVNNKKNLKGSAMAGSLGGFNAQASNIITAIYLATGQDPAQNVVSASCLTDVELVPSSQFEGMRYNSSSTSIDDTKLNEDGIRITCTMPSIEVGTIGGGTHLPAQFANLRLLGNIQGPDSLNPGNHSKTLARIVSATVLAGELSLLAALTQGSLVRSHLALNR